MESEEEPDAVRDLYERAIANVPPAQVRLPFMILKKQKPRQHALSN